MKTAPARPAIAYLAAKPHTPAQWVYLALWLCFLFGYPFALIGVAFDVHAGFSMAWAGSAMLFLQGALAALCLAQCLGMLRGGLLVAWIALGSWAVEALGASTGWPFGRYHYMSVLFPMLPGRVPLPVLGAWLLIVTTACALACWLIPARLMRPGPLLLAMRVLMAAIVGTALDLVLEPVAVHIEGYWVWQSAGPYYGIPVANFGGWAALCALLALPVLAALPHMPHIRLTLPPDLVGSAIWLFALTAALFAAIDLTHGFLLAALCGIALLAAIARRALSSRPA
jgi:putative membrane protein